MQKLIKLSVSRFEPSVETVENLTIKIFVPYSDSFVTVQINPNIQDYVENADSDQMKVRQVMVTGESEDTQTLRFDFADNNIHQISVENKKYEVKLMRIGKENLQGQDFPFFEFLISVG